MKLFKKILYLLLLIAFFEMFLTLFTDINEGQILYYSNFSNNKDLKIYKLYETDESGILKINNSFVNQSLKNNSNSLTFNSEIIADGILNITNDFQRLDSTLNLTNINQDKITEFEKNVINAKFLNSHYFNILKNYIENPFNKDGFRSIDIHTNIANSKKIMLIGDSFVWGLSANPIYNSYSDILLSRGYLIYNFGIIGTDPAQYEAILKKYTPIINPDIVLINFYEGNDYMTFERTPKYEEPLEHYTNYGFLESIPLGRYLSPEEALDFYFKMMHIPNTEKNLFNKICSLTKIGTILWKSLHFSNILYHPQLTPYEREHNKSRLQKAIITRKYIDNINKFGIENQISVKFCIIPEKYDWSNMLRGCIINNEFEESRNFLFDGIEYYIPTNLVKEDYETGNGSHFVNSGALKYADFLDIILINHFNKYD